ncbi:MAG: exonuclease SbcCD subunit D [Candidatus Aenigmarchaeota archaeon]|nr:exonuclease SbcCD subunit D [Candidatus Aenigmarchaeota archaeon]
MKFIHTSDVHLGTWNAHPDLRDFSLKAFEQLVNTAINRQIDFIIIAGDFFDTSMPAVDIIRFAAAQLKRCKDAGISVYAIAGSHDFSPTGKTMLSVFDSAGLLINLHKKLIVDKKTQVQITGIEGLRIGLDKKTFEEFDFSSILENIDKNKFKIFVMHTAIREYCPIPMMEATPIDTIPKGFDYYATGHVHFIFDTFHEGWGQIAFPGSLFQVNFNELEKHDKAGFYIVHVENNKPTMEWVSVQLKKVFLVDIDGTDKSTTQIESEFIENIENSNLEDKIVLLKTKGKLKSGKASDINFSLITEKAIEKKAYCVKRSVHLTLEQTMENKVDITGMKDVEKEVLEKIIEKESIEKYSELIEQLLNALKEERLENEKNNVYEEKIKSNVMKALNI